MYFCVGLIYQKFSNFFCRIDDPVIGENKLTGFGPIQLQDPELCLGVVRADQVISLMERKSIIFKYHNKQSSAFLKHDNMIN